MTATIQKQIKAIIFDYGKVISHSPNTTTRQDIADAYGVPEEEIGNLMKKYIGDFRTGKLSEDNFWVKVSADLNKPIPQNKYELWRNDFRKKLEISEVMLDFVRYLKTLGFKTAVVSNNIPPYVEVIKERDGFKDFDVVLNSCEVGLSKPDEEIFMLALDRLNVQPNSVLFVDDRQENLDTAEKLGMKTLLVTETEKLIEDIRLVLEI